jgi:hypothetical protein
MTAIIIFLGKFKIIVFSRRILHRTIKILMFNLWFILPSMVYTINNLNYYFFFIYIHKA